VLLGAALRQWILAQLHQLGSVVHLHDRAELSIAAPG